MGRPNAKTDRELSIKSDEFIWDAGGHSEAHRFLADPIVRLLRASKARTVLDLGCGNGALSGYIGAKGFGVTGCDFSRSGIDLAREQFPKISFFQHDVSQALPSEHRGKYDAVISTEVIEHLLLPRNLMTNAVWALKPGGIFILTTPYHGYWKNLALALTNKFDDHWHPLRDFGHIKFFSRHTITALFVEHGFQRIHFETAGRLPIFACSMIVSGIKPT